MGVRTPIAIQNANCNIDNSSQRRPELPRRSLLARANCQRNRDQWHREQRAARDLIDSGSVFVNEPVRQTRGCLLAVKESGYGRELSTCGIKEFVNVKTVVVAGDRGDDASKTPRGAPRA